MGLIMSHYWKSFGDMDFPIGDKVIQNGGHTMTTGDKGAKQRHPKPWRKDENGFVVDANGIDVAWYEHIDEALIAVNCHAELLEACKELKKQIRTLRAERKEDWKQERVNTVWAAIVQADKAIAKAEGRA